MKRIILSILLLCSLQGFAQGPVLNEIMSSNRNSLHDEDQDTPDWIELYNPKGTAQQLQGFYLSDDSLNTTKWQFDSIQIAPKGYLLIFASGKDRHGSSPHTNFKISAAGETLLLCNAQGEVIDSITMPPMQQDYTYARTVDGLLPWKYQEPTPGKKNSVQSFEGFADEVTASLPGGFYQSEITVELNANDSDIFYTTDCYIPNQTNSTIQYSSPIEIRETTVIISVANKPGYLPGPVVTRTYFIGETTDLPVISLVSTPRDLFDYNDGILADGPGWTPDPPHYGANYWLDWEKPAHIQFYDDEKSLQFAENCGISVYGWWSRSYAQKSLAIKFRGIYGAPHLEYPLFPDLENQHYESFILRNSGNDFHGTHIRDAMMHTLVEDLDIDYLEYRPCIAYINGRFWGIYNMREKISEHYIAYRHNLDPYNIDMLENNMRVIHGDKTNYQQLINTIDHQDMSTSNAYEYINERIDLEECLLYFASEIYFNNRDWPGSNIKYWREKSEAGRWRWILYDTDFGFNFQFPWDHSFDLLAHALSPEETYPANPPWSTLLLRKLVENPFIKERFINKFADLLNTNFLPLRVTNTIHRMHDHIANDLPRHRSRWFHNGQDLDRLLNFAQERPDHLRSHIQDNFSCGDTCRYELHSTQGGTLHLNSLSFIPDSLPWSGIYFTENPVHLRAVPDPGHFFSGWSGTMNSSDDTLSISGFDRVELYATFSRDTIPLPMIVINEINYNSWDQHNTGDWIELYNAEDSCVNLSNWRLKDSNPDNVFIFPENTKLDSKHFAVIVQNHGFFTYYNPDSVNIIGEFDFGFSGSGEHISIEDSSGQIVDSLTYDDRYPWPEEADGTGSTLELTDPLADNSRGENWQASSGFGSPGSVNVVIPTGVSDSSSPASFRLSQNYPNPFNLSTTLAYHIRENCHVELSIYNNTGQFIKMLKSGDHSPGEYRIEWSAEGFSSGIYLIRLKAGNFIDIKKMILLQ